MEEDKPASSNGNAEAEKDAAGGPKKDRKPGAESAKEEDGEEDLSEEDAALKEQLELLVERVQDSDAGVQKLALDTIRSEIRSATSSMTSVPKPLKFLRPHYGTLKDFFARMPAGDNKVRHLVCSGCSGSVQWRSPREALSQSVAVRWSCLARLFCTHPLIFRTDGSVAFGFRCFYLFDFLLCVRCRCTWRTWCLCWP